MFRERESDFEALGRAWDASVAYARAQPEEAREIMRHRLGSDEDPAAFAAMFDKFEWLDGEATANFRHGGPTRTDLRDHAGGDRVLSEMGELKMALSPADVITHGVWD